jgi:hypothetical protein
MVDIWNGRGESIDSPASNAAAVTPSDSADLAFASRALQATTGAGLAYVDMVGVGTNVAIYLQLGDVIPVRVTRVYSTSTAATGIVAFW